MPWGYWGTKAVDLKFTFESIKKIIKRPSLTQFWILKIFLNKTLLHKLDFKFKQNWIYQRFFDPIFLHLAYTGFSLTLVYYFFSYGLTPGTMNVISCPLSKI